MDNEIEGGGRVRTSGGSVKVEAAGKDRELAGGGLRPLIGAYRQKRCISLTHE